MSWDSGWKALHMEMTDQVPRTEYSADFHWDLIQKVTDINTQIPENREKASQAFIKAWDYAFIWSTTINGSHLEKSGGRVTKMGHADYSESSSGTRDFDTHIQCPFKNLEEVYALDPVEEYGYLEESKRIQLFEDHYEANKSRNPDTLNMAGVYVTLFSGLIEIFGWEMLLFAIGKDPKQFGKVIEGYYQWIRPYYEAFAKSSVPVMMSHDDLVWSSGPVTHPDWYRTYIIPYLKKLWQPVKEAGKKLIFTCDGNYSALVDDIMDGEYVPDMLVMEPTTDMEYIAKTYGHLCGFVGNADCRILLSGPKEAIYKEVERCMNIGKTYPGYILAVGNHLPPNTPVDHALYYQDAYMELSRR